MKNDRTSNHEKAPICAAFVKEMREVFGEDVAVTWVKEGDFEIGQRESAGVVATTEGRNSKGREECGDEKALREEEA